MHVQLLDGRGPLQVGRDEHRLRPRCLIIRPSLPVGRCFAGALQAAQHQHGRRRGLRCSE